MSDPKRLNTASPYIRELLRLNAEQVAAKQRGDLESAQMWTDELTLLLRYHGTGRLDEWFARQEQKA